MDTSSLKPQPVIAEVLPGFTVLAGLAAAYFYGHPELLHRVLRSGPAVAAVGGVGLLGSWIAGTFLDALGNILEETWLHRKSRLNWDFLMTADDGQVARLNEWYLAYYLLDRNYAIASIVLFVAVPVGEAFGWIALGQTLWALFIASDVAFGVVCAVDAFCLRDEMSRLMK
jgi:hypothetical protein